jgi:hypothetical protein
MVGHPQQTPRMVAPLPKYLVIDLRGPPELVRPPSMKIGGGCGHHDEAWGWLQPPPEGSKGVAATPDLYQGWSWPPPKFVVDGWPFIGVVNHP